MIFSTLMLTIFVFLPAIPLAQAQECPDDGSGYCLLEPIFVDQVDKRVDMAGYLQSIYKVFFITAGILATLMLIWGGFQYMTSEIPGMKGKGKDQMNNAIFGLLLAFGSYLILNTINPGLTNINFNLRPIPNIQRGTHSTSTLPQTPGMEAPSGINNPWPSDEATREIMRRQVPGLTFNKDNCEKIGQLNCTSVAGISSIVVSKLKELQTACNCQLVVSGGTEYWLHGNLSPDLNSNPTDHRPGGRVIDLIYSGGVSREIETNGAKLEGVRECHQNLNYPHYRYKGALYVHETDTNHWHVCY
jgi:hypothetical protein